MTKKLSIAGLVVAAAASSAFAFAVAPAKAACLPSDPGAICSTFNPSTASNVVDYAGFTGSANSTTDPFDQARVQFRFSGTWNTPFIITGIVLKGQGITSSLSFPNLTVNSTPNNFTTNMTAWTNLNSTLSTVDFAAAPVSQLSFTIPAGAATPGATLTARFIYANEDGQSLVSGNNFSTTATAGGGGAGVPGPLPLLGAGAAFGFSRRMRNQIKQAA